MSKVFQQGFIDTTNATTGGGGGGGGGGGTGPTNVTLNFVNVNATKYGVIETLNDGTYEVIRQTYKKLLPVIPPNTFFSDFVDYLQPFPIPYNASDIFVIANIQVVGNMANGGDLVNFHVNGISTSAMSIRLMNNGSVPYSDGNTEVWVHVEAIGRRVI